MNFRTQTLTLMVGLALCGTAAARRGINTDGWSVIGNGTTSSISENSSSPLPDGASLPGGISLSFAPGTSLASYVVESNGTPGYDMFNWVGGPTAADGGYSTQEQVLLEVQSPNQFTLDFNYADVGCAGETATLKVNSLSFSAANPCKLGTEVSGTSVFSGNPYDYFDSHFTFDVTANGSVQLVGASPWAGTVSAPEIDPNSAIAGLTLLLGGVASLTGRRRSHGINRIE